MEVAPNIVAQHAGDAGHQHKNGVDHHRLAAAPAEVVDATGQQVLKHCNHSGEAGERHKQEEQRAPYTSAGHVHEHIGQGDEDQAGTLVGADAVGETGREDDQAAHQRHKRVQRTDAQRLTGQRLLPGHIAAENLHCADAQAQRKERLVHRRSDYVAEARFFGPLPAGQQVKGQSFSGVLQRQRMDCQHQDQHQQRAHHHLGDALQAILQAQAHHAEAQQHRHRHPGGHFRGIPQQAAKHASDCIGIQAVKCSHCKFKKITQHPSGNSGIIHHEQVAARQAEDAVNVPLGAFRFQRLIGLHRTAASGTAHCQLHHQHRRAHDDQEQQIEQHKDAAAALSCHIGKPPDVADADGTARADQQEPQTGPETISFHWNSFLLFNLDFQFTIL